MNIIKYINRALLAAAVTASATSLTSCNDFLNLEPQGVFGGAELETDLATVEATVTAAYAGLYCHFFGNNPAFAGPITNWVHDVRSDDAYKGGGDTSMEGNIHLLEIGNVQNDNVSIFNKWENNYYAIVRCNKAIQAVTEIGDYPNKKSHLAELKTLRAYFYYDLYRVFDKFQYFTEKDDAKTVSVNKYTREEIYKMIKADLKDAYKELPEKQAQMGRFNRFAAAAINAKLSAFESDWDEVLYWSNEIMQNSGCQLYPNFLDMSKIENNGLYECLVTVYFSTANNFANINWCNLLNTTKAPGRFYGDADGNGGDDFYIGSQNLINCYRTDANGLPILDGTVQNVNVTVTTNISVDPRLDFTFGRIGMPWRNHEYTKDGWCRAYDIYGEYSSKKCLLDPEDPAVRDGFPWGATALCFNLIRYTDIVLLRAEALIESKTAQDLPEARNLINSVRNRAKFSVDASYTPVDINPLKAKYLVNPYPATGWNEDYARKAVRMERRLELAMEGNRWFDLVRWGEVVNTMNTYYQTESQLRTYLSGASLNEDKVFFPVPLNEATLAPELYK